MKIPALRISGQLVERKKMKKKIYFIIFSSYLFYSSFTHLVFYRPSDIHFPYTPCGSWTCPRISGFLIKINRKETWKKLIKKCTQYELSYFYKLRCKKMIIMMDGLECLRILSLVISDNKISVCNTLICRWDNVRLILVTIKNYSTILLFWCSYDN